MPLKKAGSTSITTGRMTRAARKQKQFQMMDGQVINPIDTPKRAAIVSGLSALSTQSVMPSGNPHKPTNLLAADFLAGLSCSVSSESKTFSLLANQTDDETIDNPRILSRKDYEMIEIDSIEATDKFPTTQDPFYELDEQMSLSRQARQPKTQPSGRAGGDLTQISSYISQLNSSHKTTTKTKYFSSDGAIIAQRRSKF
jgi:hypothetical protein